MICRYCKGKGSWLDEDGGPVPTWNHVEICPRCKGTKVDPTDLTHVPRWAQYDDEQPVLEKPVKKPRDYDSTVARIAGNILSGARHLWDSDPDPESVDSEEVNAVKQAVRLARAIVEETKRTEPNDVHQN